MCITQGAIDKLAGYSYFNLSYFLKKAYIGGAHLEFKCFTERLTIYSKTCVKRPLKIDKKGLINDNW